jgi:uncharacterized protein (TIRG00374 family)
VRFASLGVGVGVLIAFIYFVGLVALARVLLQVNPVVIVVMLIIQLLGFAFYATAWYLLIRSTGHILPFRTCQGITLASIFVSYAMPSGVFLEAVRCILGSKESGMKLGESTATVIMHRVLYIVGFLVSTAIAFLVLLLGGRASSALIFQLAALPLLALGGLFSALYLSLRPRTIEPLLDRGLRLVQPVIRIVQKQPQADAKAGQFLDDYHIAFRRMLSSTVHLVASFIASLGDWSCSVLILWVVLIAVGSSASLWAVVVTMAIGKMIQMTPIAVPGMIGIYEAAITAALSWFGVPVAIGASAALLSRIVTSWLDLPVTGVAAYHYGYKTLGQLSF